MEKKCFKCGDAKARTEFYRHPQMVDGLLGKCKECTKMDARTHRDANLGKILKYDRNRPNATARKADARRRYRERISTPEGRAREWAAKKKYAIGDRRACHIIVCNAIRDGRLKRMPCERCQAEEHIHAHHENYTKPMDVIWLCRPCHGKRHREINEERRARTDT